jgi:hypothetical protein
MGQTRAVVIALVVDEYLGFVFEAAECCTVNDPVAIALESRSVVLEGLRVTATA